MVKITERKVIWYICEVCGEHHSTEDAAKECEAKKQYKIDLCQNDNKWKKGDLIWVEEHGTPFYMRLGIVSGQIIKGHKIIPLVSIIGEKTVPKEWTQYVLQITGKERKQVLKWLDIIKNPELLKEDK